MEPPDYWPDARRIPKEQLKLLVDTIRSTRESLGISNATLCREVRTLISAHNAIPGRDPVAVSKMTDPREYAEHGKTELAAIRKGTRKYVVGYLAWLCLRDEAAAREFYKRAGLTYQPYPIEAAPAEDDEKIGSWTDLFRIYGTYERLEVIPIEARVMGLIDLADREPVAGSLRLDERFCFRFNAPTTGSVLAFQRYRGNWYPLPLSASALHVSVKAGVQVLPMDMESREPIPLSESEETGKFGFAFIIADDTRIPELSAQLSAGSILAPELVGLAIEIVRKIPKPLRAIYRADVTITA